MAACVSVLALQWIGELFVVYLQAELQAWIGYTGEN